ncbi:MAG: NAD(P)/FAD-dependent oxidoreductase [Sulfurovum sp.]|nr:NAD(P)/FAD-dependent oxidoreductase [Sulfurovum sp.]
MDKTELYDLVIIGAGAAGMMAAIAAAEGGIKVLILEKLPKIATKLKATGGGKCNISNTLANEAFMEAFGREGRFMQYALESLDQQALRDFFATLGIETDVLDGLRIFPVGHQSQSIIGALANEISRLGVVIHCNSKIMKTVYTDKNFNVYTNKEVYQTPKLIIATGGKGYPQLGAEGDGYKLAASLGHSFHMPHPAMMPLKVAEQWVNHCCADTIAKARIIVDIKKYKNYRAVGDLIFTKGGIRGPVVLDFSREITPLLAKLKEVPILINITKGMSEEEIRTHIKSKLSDSKHYNTLQLVETLLPSSISQVICTMANINPALGFAKQSGVSRAKLIKLLAWTPLTIIGHDGFDKAMITRGGIKLKEINSRTMESKLVEGLYFCGEVVDLDGPCGGYNLQWAFSSGYLAGSSTLSKI